MKQFNEDNLDILQNIEFAIVGVHRAEPALLDMDVKDAIDALVRYYHAEEEQRTPPAMSLAECAQRVFAVVKEVCEWRLGRGRIKGDSATSGPAAPVSIMVKCLREIQKSIPRWTKQGGRKGYLEFVSRFIV